VRLDAAVLGAGPAGLAAAWELAERGAAVALLEAGPAVGGMAGTVERGGWRFDYGGHRFLTRWPELEERVAKLLGEDLLRVDRHSVVISDGRRIGYPLELGDLLRRAPLRRGLRYLASWAQERLRRPARDGSTFEGFMTARFGPALYAEFFAPYTRKLWGLDPALLASDWAPQRIGAFDLGQALRHLLGTAREQPRTYARSFLYPRLGMGQLFTAIAGEIARCGGQVLCASEVTGLVLEAERVRAVRTPAGDVEARNFISTLPLDRLCALLGQPRALRWRGLRFVNVRLDAPAQLGSTWAYLSDGAGRVSRVQEPARRSPFMVPPGRGSLQLEVPCSPGDELWELEAQALFERTWPELEAAGLHPAARVRGAFATRLDRAYPVLTAITRRECAAALARSDALPNLQVVGRQGRFSYLFSDRAMEQGIAAARRILGVPEALPGPEDPTCTTEAGALQA
jgi:protoporphyrinogen oxidase